jgi:hypothetical protein
MHAIRVRHAALTVRTSECAYFYKRAVAVQRAERARLRRCSKAAASDPGEPAQRAREQCALRGRDHSAFARRSRSCCMGCARESRRWQNDSRGAWPVVSVTPCALALGFTCVNETSSTLKHEWICRSTRRPRGPFAAHVGGRHCRSSITGDTAETASSCHSEQACLTRRPKSSLALPRFRHIWKEDRVNRVTHSCSFPRSAAVRAPRDAHDPPSRRSVRSQAA